MRGFEPGTTLGELPLFPLPQAVLFPGALIPLHIFEPRYRTMTVESLGSNSLLGIVSIQNRDETNQQGQPRIARVAGLGEIVEHEKLADGRFNILVLGRARIELAEQPYRPPYRRGNAVVLASTGTISKPSRTSLIAAAQNQAEQIRRQHPDFRFNLAEATTDERLIDLCSHALIADGRKRQHLLETLDLERRLNLCLEFLLDQVPLSGRTMN